MGISTEIKPEAQGGRRCLFLDRDGVVNRSVVREGKPFPPADISEVVYVEGIAELCQAARDSGWLVVLATNQPDVGRGTTSRETVEEIHRTMMKDLAIDAVEVCYDPGRGEESSRRKPEPGMLLEAAERMGINLAKSYMIGDRWKDIGCGRRAGCQTIFIDYGYDEEMIETADHWVTSLGEAARHLPFLV